MVEKIDFVVAWVDGNDPVWQEKKSSYDGSVNTSKQSMNSVKAYREWGTFKYWFRGVEKFAPWVNKVYLVTDQQKPSWLDINSEKFYYKCRLRGLSILPGFVFYSNSEEVSSKIRISTVSSTIEEVERGLDIIQDVLDNCDFSEINLK